MIARSIARRLWRRPPALPRPIVPAAAAQRSGRAGGAVAADRPGLVEVVRVVEDLAAVEARRRFHADVLARVAAAPRTA